MSFDRRDPPVPRKGRRRDGDPDPTESRLEPDGGDITGKRTAPDIEREDGPLRVDDEGVLVRTRTGLDRYLWEGKDSSVVHVTRVDIPVFLVVGNAAEDLRDRYHVVHMRHFNPMDRPNCYPSGSTWTLCIHRQLSRAMMEKYVRHVALVTAERIHAHYTTRSNLIENHDFIGCAADRAEDSPGRRLHLYPMHDMLRIVNGMLRNTNRLWAADGNPLQVYLTSLHRLVIVPDRRPSALAEFGFDSELGGIISQMAALMEDDERGRVVAEQTWLDAANAPNANRPQIDDMKREALARRGMDRQLPPLVSTLTPQGTTLAFQERESIVSDYQPHRFSDTVIKTMESDTGVFVDPSAVFVQRASVSALGWVPLGQYPPKEEERVVTIPFYEHGVPLHLLRIRRNHHALASLAGRFDFLFEPRGTDDE